MSLIENLRTKQEVFDYVAIKLIEQDRASMFGTDCQYRTPDGCRCAAGWLIPDDEYSAEMEGELVWEVATRSPTLNQLERSFGEVFLQQLQSAHDGGHWYPGGNPTDLTLWPNRDPDWLGSFKARMRIVAQNHGLNAEVLNAEPR
jgi:hypothetical protein